MIATDFALKPIFAQLLSDESPDPDAAELELDEDEDEDDEDEELDGVEESSDDTDK